ncbi:MAG: septal ring lytic transglycosylase RlpA family protein [Saprospiraceae bacterium]
MKYIPFLIAAFVFFAFQPAFAQEEEYGLASYFSDDYNGRGTAYGMVYDKEEMTCAHKRHPAGTMLKVTRLDNNKFVVVKVIDKGPFIKGRVVDLSRKAAQMLGIIDMGDVQVKVELMKKSSTTEEPAPTPQAARAEEEASSPAESKPATYSETAQLPATPAPSAPVAEKDTDTKEPPAKAASTTVAEKQPNNSSQTTTTVSTQSKPSNDRVRMVGDDYSVYGLYKITLEKPRQTGGFGVQVASFSNYENVLQKVAELQAKWFEDILVSVEPATGGKNNYRVILGHFDDQSSATRYQRSLSSRYKISGFVVDFSSLKH